MVFLRQKPGDMAHDQVRVMLARLSSLRAFLSNGRKDDRFADPHFEQWFFAAFGTLPEIIQEMLLTRTSERQGRVIDHDGAGSMEEKKRQGYF